MRPPSLLRIALVSLLACGLACGKAPPAGPAGSRGASATSASSLDLYFPLEHGKIYHYVTRDGSETGMLVAMVHRTDATHGELRLSNATKRFSLGAEGIAYDGGAYILKAPADVGASWPGEHGGTTRIVATDVPVEVPAGRYASCLRTVEEGGRPPGSRYETTYCPGVGMVLLVVTAGETEARAELKSYGMPVKVE